MQQLFSSRLFLLITLIAFLYSCANRVSPTGGNKDVKPPQIKETTPTNFSTNFKEKKITIAFDEFIQLKDINKQLVISPLMEPEPKISVKKKSLIIRLPDSLKANTTYNLNFGEAITDLNEGNSIADFQYVFSTGDVLDSLFYTGKVMDAYSHKTEKAITVMLYHDQEDSLPFKKVPDYFARTDEQGNFTIKNISPGTYKLFALNDKNNNYRCDNPQEEAIAFADSIITIPGSESRTLQLFTQAPGKLFVKKSLKETNGPVIISFSKRIADLSWNLINQNTTIKTLNFVSQNKDSLFIWVIDSTVDSLKLALLNNNIPFDTVEIALKKTQSGARSEKIKNTFSFSTNLNAATLKPNDILVVAMHNPVMSATIEQIKLFQDSIPVKDYKIFFNDSLHRYLSVQSKWTESASYKLIAPPSVFKDVNNIVSDSITINFNVNAVTELGTMKTIISGLEKGSHYVLQLVNENLQIIQQMDLDGTEKHTFENITPASYKLRLFNDTNNNKQWDNGDYWKKTQPEEFYYYPDAIQIRANWELEINMDVKF